MARQRGTTKHGGRHAGQLRRRDRNLVVEPPTVVTKSDSLATGHPKARQRAIGNRLTSDNAAAAAGVITYSLA